MTDMLYHPHEDYVKTRTLRELREHTGKSQKEVAMEMGIFQSEVCRIEKQKNPKVDIIRRFIMALGGKSKLVASLLEEEFEVINESESQDV